MKYNFPTPQVHRQEFNLFFPARLYWAMLQKANSSEKIRIFNTEIKLEKSNSHLAILKDNKLKRLSKIHIAYNKEKDQKKLHKYFICDVYSNDKKVYYYRKDQKRQRLNKSLPGTYVNIVTVNMSKEEAINTFFDILKQLKLSKFIKEYQKNKSKNLEIYKNEFLKDLELYIRFDKKHKKDVEFVIKKIEEISQQNELEKIKNNTMYKIIIDDLSKIGINTKNFKVEIKMYTLKKFQQLRNDNFLSSIKLEVSMNKKERNIQLNEYNQIYEKLKQILAFISYHADIDHFISDQYFSEFKTTEAEINEKNFIAIIKRIKEEEIKYYQQQIAVDNRKSVLAILEQIINNSFCTIKYISDRTKLHYDTVRKMLKKLEEKGILQSQTGLGGVKTYMFKNQIAKETIKNIIELEQELIKMTLIPEKMREIEEAEDEEIDEDLKEEIQRMIEEEAITEYVKSHIVKRKRKAKEIIKIESYNKEELQKVIKEAEKEIEKQQLNEAKRVEIIIREVRYIDEDLQELKKEDQHITKIKRELEKLYGDTVKKYYSRLDFSKIHDIVDAEYYLFSDQETAQELRKAYNYYSYKI